MLVPGKDGLINGFEVVTEGCLSPASSVLCFSEKKIMGFFLLKGGIGPGGELRGVHLGLLNSGGRSYWHLTLGCFEFSVFSQKAVCWIGSINGSQPSRLRYNPLVASSS